MNQFLADVLKGLQIDSKISCSRNIFTIKEVMNYSRRSCIAMNITSRDCEMEIFSTQTSQIADIVIDQHHNFDVVELGPGDAVKSVYLLKELVNKNAVDTYFPVDISNNIIDLLHKKLPKEIPDLNIHGLNGEYLAMLSSAKQISDKIKLVLFLGSNIGNISKQDVPFNFAKNYATNFQKEIWFY